LLGFILEINLENNKPLCVDLDGTLIQTDTLLESMLLAAKQKPIAILLFLFWILKGRAYLKKKTAEISIPDATLLPYKANVIEYVRKEKVRGRKIVLATATNKKIAESVSGYLGIFDEVIATENDKNLRSKNKSEVLTELYGEKGFDYIGDSRADINVWKSASGAILVEPSRNLLKKAKLVSNVIKVFDKDKNTFKLFIKEIRIHQWIKNILIFFPFLMAHKLDVNILFQALYAFASFSLIASFVYVLNDVLDLESDRIHPRKRKRPLASGNLSIDSGILLAPLLLLGGLAIGIFLLPIEFLYILITYIVLTTAYSFILKKIIILDAIVLACLYTLRLIAGANAVDVDVSPWLLGFSIFFFLSLAIMKRYTELHTLLEQNKTRASGRGYRTDDISFLKTIGPSTGFLSILIFALYVNSEKVVSLYNTPELLWLTLLCLLYWIGRIWLKTQRGEMEDDPIVFTVKDPVSYVIGLIVVLLVVGATI
jgi:4-hydroxybenzoate polyprenyltransferase